MAAQQAGNGSDPDSNFILAIFVIGLVLLIAWFLKDYIVYGVLTLAKWKAFISSFIIPDERMAKAAVGIGRLDWADYKEMTYAEAFQIANFAGRYVGWLMAGLIGFGALRLATRTPISRFRRNMTMKRLLEQKALKFPAVRPVIGLDIDKKPMDSGPWASMRSSIDLCMMEKLMYGLPGGAEDIPANRRLLKGKSWRDVDRDHVSEYRFDREKAKAVLERQLGIPIVQEGIINIPGWRTWPEHYKALIAVFLLRGFPQAPEDRAQSDELLIQFNDSFYYPNYKKTGKPEIVLDDLDTEGVEDVLSRYLDNPGRNKRELVKILASHAYLTTLIFQLLHSARRRGILNTADFIWLRPIDRTLWYLLNGAGRRTAPAEAAGPWAHYEVEDMLGTHCVTPEVWEGVLALERDLIKEGWILEENTPDAIKARANAQRGRRGRAA
ncbi:hypothetical protein [Marinobacterium sp. BA1]|uniref:secretion/conjugation apparatus DotM-related subunit n=1 Tax=Marinobacterium sp. BA1 TaxID=3138931 RepID=UPI0032E71A6D